MKNEKLKKSIDKLKNNKNKVPLDVLKTKYKKSYYTLLEDIKDMATKIIKDESLSGLKILEDNKDKFVYLVNERILKEKKEGGVLKKASIALFKDYDLEVFYECVVEMKSIIKSIESAVEVETKKEEN